MSDKFSITVHKNERDGIYTKRWNGHIKTETARKYKAYKLSHHMIAKHGVAEIAEYEFEENA